MNAQLQSEGVLLARSVDGHLSMHEAPSRDHELEVARPDLALIALRVFVLEFAFEHVREGGHAAVGMVGKACALLDEELCGARRSTRVPRGKVDEDARCRA